MVVPKRKPFARIFEVDKMMIPRQPADDPVVFGAGRGCQAKIRISGAAEVQGNLLGRVQSAAIKDFSAESLHALIKPNIAPGTTAETDSYPAYEGAPSIVHDPHVAGPMAAYTFLT